MADEDDAGGPGGPAVRPAELGGRKAGRPQGATNRRSKAMVDWLAGLGYRDPAVVLAEAMSRSTAEIVDALGCEPLEAEKLRLGAAEALMPYMHGKMPLEVKVSDERLPVLVLPSKPDPERGGGGQGGGGAPLSIGHRWDEQNQGVIDLDPVQSHGGKSHE